MLACFQHLEKEELSEVLDAMFLVKKSAGETVIEQVICIFIINFQPFFFHCIQYLMIPFDPSIVSTKSDFTSSTIN